MYVRLTKTVKDNGRLIKPDKIFDLIDMEADWYYSPFIYGDDALQYFEEHKKSIKGYTGKAYTNSLYWDLDCKEDFVKARDNALKLIYYLEDQGYRDGLEIFFSGNKGFHVFLHTINEFNPQQTKKICYNVAIKAGVSQDVFDTTVYNVNRIFRVPYTKHQVSGLYKIPLELEMLEKSDPQEIRDAARTNEYPETGYDNVDATDLLEQFGKIIEPEVLDNVVNLESVRKLYGEDFNPLDCPPEKRRCMYVLENGYFGSGERENASIRIVAYEQAQGKTREETRDILTTALNKRSNIYKDLNQWNQSDIERVLDEVYSENWNGGAYSCRTDEYLRSKCDLGQGCCANDKRDDVRVNAIRIGSLIDRYVEYSNEALIEYPKMGLDWIDSKVRFRPRNFSIINGSNGCVDADTEFLSPEGWKRIADWNGERVMQYDSENGIASFTKPDSFIKLPSKSLIHFKHEYGLDQVLSEEHKVLYYTSRKNLATKAAKEIAESCKSNRFGFSGVIPMVFKVNTSGLEITELQLRLQVAIICDGYFPNINNTVVLNLKKRRKIKRLLKLLKESKIEYREVKAAKGYRRFSFKAPFKDKVFDSKYYKCSQDQLDIISEEIMYWDGCKTYQSFSTTSLETAKFIQYALSTNGTRASISKDSRINKYRNGSCYTVNRTSQIGVSLRTPNLIPKEYKTIDGFKYCFTVPTGYLILRRNRNLFVTGNSGKTSLAIEFMNNLNEQKIWHIIFSLDMADTSFFEKIGAKHTRYSQKEIESAFNVHSRNEEIIKEVAASLKECYPYTLFDFTSSVDVYYIENAVQTLKTREIDPINIQVVFIDYAGRVIGDKDSEYSNATEIALRANDTAKRTNTHLCFLSQIPREDGDHTKSIRSSRVSKNSGAWEENATVVINCWRPFGNGLKNLDRFIHIYIAKNRSGELGERVYSWEGKTGTIFEMDKKTFGEYYNLCEQHGKEEPEPQFSDDDVINNPMFSYEKPPAKVAFNSPRVVDDTSDEKVSNDRKNVQHTKTFGGSGKSFKVSKK